LPVVSLWSLFVSRVSATKFSAIVSILLGVSAIVLPQMFGTAAVMILAAVMLASGLIALLYVNAARREGFAVSVFGPWARIIAGIVLILWPGLALWLVAVVLGGGLILSGITGLSALKDSRLVNPPKMRKIELWATIGLGVLLIVMGAAGSALLLGIIFGVSLIGTGLQQWRMASG
jgi:uncharacterized membrane protein HdeD (DUF308 family)